jgi:hypothetical protein
MNEPIRIAFDVISLPSTEKVAVVYNAGVLSSALLSQMMRFGLRLDPRDSSSLSGVIKGRKEDLLNMIQSYGFAVDILPPSILHPAHPKTGGSL